MATKLGIWNRALSRIGETDKIESEEEDRAAATMCALHYDDILRDMLSLYPWSWAIKETDLPIISDISEDRDGDGTSVTNIPTPYENLISPSSVTVTTLVTSGLAVIEELELVAGVAGAGEYRFYPQDGVTPAYIQHQAFAAGTTVRIEINATRNGWEYAYGLPGDFVYGCGILSDDVKFTMMANGHKAEWEIVPNPNGDSQMLLCDIAVDDMAGFQYIALIDNPAAWPTQFAEAFIWRLAAELADALKKDPKVSERCWQRYALEIDRAAAYAQNNGHLVEPTSPMIAARG